MAEKDVALSEAEEDVLRAIPEEGLACLLQDSSSKKFQVPDGIDLDEATFNTAVGGLHLHQLIEIKGRRTPPQNRPTASEYATKSGKWLALQRNKGKVLKRTAKGDAKIRWLDEEKRKQNQIRRQRMGPLHEEPDTSAAPTPATHPIVPMEKQLKIKVGRNYEGKTKTLKWNEVAVLDFLQWFAPSDIDITLDCDSTTDTFGHNKKFCVNDKPMSDVEFTVAARHLQKHECVEITKYRVGEAGERRAPITLIAGLDDEPVPPSKYEAKIKITTKGTDEIRHIRLEEEKKWRINWKAVAMRGLLGVGGVILAVVTAWALFFAGPKEKKEQAPTPQASAKKLPGLTVQEGLPNELAPATKPPHFKASTKFYHFEDGIALGSFLNDGGQEGTVTRVEFANVTPTEEKPKEIKNATYFPPILFEPHEYDPKTKTYGRAVQQLVAANHNAALRLGLLDTSKEEGSRYKGTVVLHYGIEQKATADVLLFVFHEAFNANGTRHGGHLSPEAESFEPMPNGLTGCAFSNDSDEEVTVMKIEFQRGEITKFDEILIGERAVPPIYFTPKDFNPKTQTYSRQVLETVKPAEPLTLRLAILDKTLPNKTVYKGKVFVHYKRKVAKADALLTVLHEKAKDDPAPGQPPLALPMLDEP